MIDRQLTGKIKEQLRFYPIVTVIGPRQSGKSTLIKNAFPNYEYVSLEDLDLRQAAIEDPRGFLNHHGERLIIDEAQHAPDLFSYLQTKTDRDARNGAYLLSGSQNFLIQKKIKQSLAGRTAILTLLPLAWPELRQAGFAPAVADLLYTGGYPRIYANPGLAPADFYEDYIKTYLERDVTDLVNVHDLSKFRNFLALCAARAGQPLNVDSLARDAAIATGTANSWLSILETGFVIHLLRPYHKNFNKRIVKAPKLFFYDTGLLSALLRLNSADAVRNSGYYGSLFENFVVAEFLKSQYHSKKTPALYFWRDGNGKEIDLLDETGGELRLFEIKSGETAKKEFSFAVNDVAELAGAREENRFVIYGGEDVLKINRTRYVPWKKMDKYFAATT